MAQPAVSDKMPRQKESALALAGLAEGFVCVSLLQTGMPCLHGLKRETGGNKPLKGVWRMRFTSKSESSVSFSRGNSLSRISL